jgi:hypothetical protein
MQLVLENKQASKEKDWNCWKVPPFTPLYKRKGERRIRQKESERGKSFQHGDRRQCKKEKGLP